MRTIAVTNQKGGCGKTTTAVNLAAAFAEKGRTVLLVDLDSQGHSTLGFGYDPDSLNKTIYDALTNTRIPIYKVLIGTAIDRLDLAPSNIMLSGAEIEMASILGREFILGEQLRKVSRVYDICIIDCPPAIGLLAINALIASTDVIVPVQVHYYAMEGLKQLFETANIIRENFHPCYVKILGLLLTFVEDQVPFSKQIEKQMRAFFGDLVFQTAIHRTMSLAEAPSAGQPVLTYAPQSKGANEYRALADEIIYGKAGPGADRSLQIQEITQHTASPEEIYNGRA